MADDGVFYTLYKISDPLQVPSVTSEQHVPLVRRIFSNCCILLPKLFRPQPIAKEIVTGTVQSLCYRWDWPDHIKM